MDKNVSTIHPIVKGKPIYTAWNEQNTWSNSGGQPIGLCDVWTKMYKSTFEAYLVTDGWAISCEIDFIWIFLDVTADKSTLFR